MVADIVFVCWHDRDRATAGKKFSFTHLAVKGWSKQSNFLNLFHLHVLIHLLTIKLTCQSTESKIQATMGISNTPSHQHTQVEVKRLRFCMSVCIQTIYS